jgi:hypothetical protein
MMGLVAKRVAEYGPVRPVVWEGKAARPPPSRFCQRTIEVSLRCCLDQASCVMSCSPTE